MSGKCRPSLRPKTLYNVDGSSLSTTDKECIRAVFEIADHQKAEIEKNEKIIKAANDLIETQKAEIERLNKEVDRLSQIVLYHDGHIADAKAEAIEEFAERLEEYKCALLYENPRKPLIDYGESVTHFGVEAVCFNDIKTVEKEMVGENDE